MSLFYTLAEMERKYANDEFIEWDIIYAANSNYSQESIRSNGTSEKIKIKLSQMVECLHNLKISNSNEPKFVYTCHRWNQSFFTVTWIIFLMILVLYTVMPMVLAYLYIQNLRGNLKSCYIYNQSNMQYYGKLGKQKWQKKENFSVKILFQLIFLQLTSCLLGGVIYTCVETKNDLLKTESSHAILKIQIFRNEE